MDETKKAALAIMLVAFAAFYAMGMLNTGAPATDSKELPAKPAVQGGEAANLTLTPAMTWPPSFDFGTTSITHLGGKETDCVLAIAGAIDRILGAPAFPMPGNAPKDHRSTIVDAKCAQYDATRSNTNTFSEQFGFGQDEAIGATSNASWERLVSSFLSMDPYEKTFYYHRFGYSTYSEECLMVGGEVVFSQTWRGGEYEPPVGESRVTNGTASCHWLAVEEIAAIAENEIEIQEKYSSQNS